ncbi:hypothetical protein D5R93_05720 [Actinomyces lilanjuaniae]|uniref:Uncharacterized protein n=1 Tax=Actinomyces lilanjuaniae TaxID=2321394 RepID=A0ABN5PMV2_9ACTO|nr:hypothetical protein [Actinomyces lilanjuaniae]AYD89670.1 hypothetical protein D5R93_05720 [Actinomyces lilanjuaniae]
MTADPVAMVRAHLEAHDLPTAAHLTRDFAQDLPVTHVYNAGGGTLTDIDRMDRVGITVYAPAPTTDDPADTPTATTLAEKALAALAGGPHDTVAGYVDEVRVESLPTFKPFTDTMDTCSMVVGVVHRTTD